MIRFRHIEKCKQMIQIILHHTRKTTLQDFKLHQNGGREDFPQRRNGVSFQKGLNFKEARKRVYMALILGNRF